MSDPGPAAPVPPLDLRPGIEADWEALRDAVLRVLRSGRYVLGPEVEAFEREAAARLGVRHAVGLNSGTDALEIGLRALGVEPGDEVVTTPFSFVATAGAIVAAGAVPVFADVEPEHLTLDPVAAEAAVTPRTRAFVPVHLYGCIAGAGALRLLADRRGLRLLEDAAQAFGARAADGRAADGRAADGRAAGAAGDAGAFSFYPTKTPGAAGDAGLLVTDDDGVAGTARLLREHGQRTRLRAEVPGRNSRLDEIQAAV
ncbi:MAG: DegT/DnrJ/EryC1/StrS family aminotransferase, partial [Longimicrobiales bacterium]|nr:DegT/DnrJ/EryC1/StrS family aminotransferase [Longimicrobiales bacterium]